MKFKLGLISAIFLVVANMIGTGIFTCLGYQVANIESTFALMALWFIGGVVALCGAFSYGELGTIYPRSGGEYHLLSKIYHPSLGFMAGWISATVGFAAPTALAAIAFAGYFKTIVPAAPLTGVAITVVLIVAIVHSISISIGSIFQNILTVIKILLLLVLVVAGFVISMGQNLELTPQYSDLALLVSKPFAISLVYVLYAYSGWNAVIYIIDDIDSPQKNLSKALIWGTLIVLILYLLTNYIFLYITPIEDLKGIIEIGHIVGKGLLGEQGAKIISGIISLILLSMIGAMIYLAPRITQVIGEDYAVLKFLSKKNSKNIPITSLWCQVGLILLFILTSSFETILMYATFTLVFINVLTVIGLFIERSKGRIGSYRAWGYPITPLFFILVNGWVLFYLLAAKTIESLIGLSILAVGLVLYFINEKYILRMKK